MSQNSQFEKSWEFQDSDWEQYTFNTKVFVFFQKCQISMFSEEQ